MWLYGAVGADGAEVGNGGKVVLEDGAEIGGMAGAREDAIGQ